MVKLRFLQGNENSSKPKSIVMPGKVKWLEFEIG